MGFPEFSGQLSDLKLGADILNMVSKTIRVSRNLMPIDFDHDSGVLTIVTSNFADNFADYSIFDVSPKDYLSLILYAKYVFMEFVFLGQL